MSQEGGENLTFRDAFASDPPPASANRYGTSNGSEDEFENDSDVDDHNARPQITSNTRTEEQPTHSTTGEADVVERALAGGLWKKQYDPTSQKYYFYNVLSRETTWDLRKKLNVNDSEVHVSLSANASINDDRNITRHPQLRLEGSFSAASDTAPQLQLPTAVLNSITNTEQMQASTKTPVKSLSASDDIEDDDVARAKIVARGGRVPLLMPSETAGDLYNQVRAFKAFASGSDQDNGSSTNSFKEPPAAQAKAPNTQILHKGLERANETQQRLLTKRTIFETDSSDFSSASQNIRKNIQHNSAIGTENTINRPSATQIDTEARPAEVASAAPAKTQNPVAVPSVVEGPSPVSASSVQESAAYPARQGVKTSSPEVIPLVDTAQVGAKNRAEVAHAVKEQSEALEYLVRAYTQLKQANKALSGPRGLPSSAHLERLISHTLQSDPDPDATGNADPESFSSRIKASRLIDRHTPSTKYARWGSATRGATREKTTALLDDKSPHNNLILDVVLSLFMEQGMSSETAADTTYRRSPPERPTSAEPDVVDNTRYERQVHIDVKLEPLAPDMFSEQGSLLSAIEVQLEKHVHQLLRRIKVEHGPATAASLSQIVRVFAMDLCLALQQIDMSSQGSQTLLPPGYALFLLKLPKQVNSAMQELQRRALFNIINSLPFEILQEAPHCEDESYVNHTEKLRLDYWVTIGHCKELIKCLLLLIRRIELSAYDAYELFRPALHGSVNSDSAIFVLPESSMVSIVLNAAARSATQSQPSTKQPERPSSESSLRLHDTEAQEAAMFTVVRLVDKVVSTVAKEHFHGEANTKALRHKAELAVSDTLSVFLGDADIEASFVRRAGALTYSALSKDPDTAVIEETQDRVNRMVERLKYEIGTGAS